MVKRILTVLFFIMMAAMLFLFFYNKWYVLFSIHNIEQARTALITFGVITPIIILVLYLGFNLAFLPTLFFSFLCGYLYGTFYGFILAWAGMSLGLLGSFLGGRYLFRDIFQKYFGDKKVVIQLENYLKEHSWKSIIFLRLFFIFPYNVQNYAYALTSVKFRIYAIGSIVGIIPITLLNAWTGNLIANQTLVLTDLSSAFKVVPVVFIMIAALLIGKRLVLKSMKK